MKPGAIGSTNPDERDELVAKGMAVMLSSVLSDLKVHSVLPPQQADLRVSRNTTRQQSVKHRCGTFVHQRIICEILHLLPFNSFHLRPARINSQSRLVEVEFDDPPALVAMRARIGWCQFSGRRLVRWNAFSHCRSGAQLVQPF